MRAAHGLVRRSRVLAGRSRRKRRTRAVCPGFAADAESAARVSRKQCHRKSDERTALMLGFVAAILFAIAFIINAANVSISNAIFSPTSLMLLGLVCLALHLSGVGTSWKYRR